MRVLIGCEESGTVRRAFAAHGHDAWSCDLLPAEDDSPNHITGDLLDVLNGDWDLAIFHPPCTYLTNAAAWALCDPDYYRWPGVGYHQKIKPETLTGAARRAARIEALEFVDALARAPIGRICMENPHGAMAGRLGWQFQSVQPHWFGDDASKATGLSLHNLPPLQPTSHIEPRWVCGCGYHVQAALGKLGCPNCGGENGEAKPRWSNQTDAGQNRARDRSRTFPGLAQAMALQWGMA